MPKFKDYDLFKEQVHLKLSRKNRKGHNKREIINKVGTYNGFVLTIVAIMSIMSLVGF